jgi:hypothetical protein
MSTTESSTSGETLADVLSLIGTIFVAGPPVIPASLATVVFALLLAGPFALLVTLVLAFFALMALVALAGAILASPFMLVRYLRARQAAHAISEPVTPQPQPQLAPVRSWGVAA